MDTKFAPGLWTLNPLKNSDSVRIFAGNHYIGSIGNSDDEPSQTRANARLIAAAPDMYEALKSVLDDVQFMIEHGYIGDVMDDILYVQARAALAKADGTK